MLALKLLLDYRGQQLDLGRIEQLIAIGHELAAGPGVNPTWQGRWWPLALQNREWFGNATGTAQALQHAQGLAQRHMLPRLRFELACVEMSAALKAADLPLAHRLLRDLDALRPAIRPGRLPHGLRAQALYLAVRGEFAAALQRLDLLLTVCADMEISPRFVGPYHVLRADCLLALDRHQEGLALLQQQAKGQWGPQRVLFDARIAMHTARSRLAMAHESLVQVQLERLLAHGAADAALRTARQALVHDPMSEPLHRALMRALLHLGERAEVLQTFRRLQALRAERLGIEPTAQTQALAREAGMLAPGGVAPYRSANDRGL